jgi:hypothetical protein
MSDAIKRPTHSDPASKALSIFQAQEQIAGQIHSAITGKYVQSI